jgi:hypothetical protein
LNSEKELNRKGWQKQSTNDEPRLSELVEAYKEIGYEVHLVPFHPEEEPGCNECMKNQADQFKTIYVRKKTEKTSHSLG